jgi:hypothetical protein
MDKTKLVHSWVGHPGWLFRILCYIFCFFVQVYEPTNNPLIVEVNVHSNGGLSFTIGESPKEGAFPKCQFAPGGCPEQGTLILKRPGFTKIFFCVENSSSTG